MYKIKPLEKENITYVYELMSEENNISALHTSVIPLEEWQKIFAQSKTDIDEENFIVFNNAIPCAWLKINGRQNKDTAWISMLVVSEAFKHQGVGSFAVEFVIDYLSELGYKNCNLHTTQDNQPAIKLYKKYGFKIIEAEAENLTFSRKLDFCISEISQDNICSCKRLKKIYANYKIQVLRNHGETPCGKRTFYALYESIITSACESDTKHFVVMQSGNKLIGFASIDTASTDVLDIPFSYGEMSDFYISPEYRRKGYGRILNNYIERVFKSNAINTVLLSPDPVTGINFWRAVGYCDTKIHQGWGRHLVFVKHLSEKNIDIDNAISRLVTDTDLISINPYNKAQIKEVCVVWKRYCQEHSIKYRKSAVRKMAFKARENKDISFKALYSEGKIAGFVYKDVSEINYSLSR